MTAFDKFIFQQKHKKQKKVWKTISFIIFQDILRF